MPPRVFVLLNKYGEIYAPPLSGGRKKELRQAYTNGLSVLREQAEGNYTVKQYHPECEFTAYLFTSREAAETFLRLFGNPAWRIENHDTAAVCRKLQAVIPYAFLIDDVTPDGLRYTLLTFVEARGI